MKSFLFWTSGGAKTGLGHVRRCLTLADALAERGAKVKFVVHGDETVIDYISSAGFRAERDSDGIRVHDFAGDDAAGTAVIDSYEVTSGEIGRLRGWCRVVVIEDLADRELPADVIVNSSPAARPSDYRGCDTARLLLGPEYALLRKDFDAGVPDGRISSCVRRVLVTVGGSDPNRLTPRLVSAVAAAAGDAGIDVMAGPLFDPALEQEILASARAVTLRKDPPDVRDLMLGADLAVCGGGQTIFELAATGTPAVAVRTAENQTLNLTAFRDAGVVEWAADAADAHLAEKVSGAVERLAADPETRLRMSWRGRAMVDGRGAARVAAALTEDA